MSNNIDAQTPTFIGKYTELRPVDMQSLKHLYLWHLELEYELAHFVLDGPKIPNELMFKENFLQQLKNRYHLFLFIYPKRKDASGEPIGFISTYRYNDIDGHVQISVFITPKYRSKHYSLEAGILLVNYLFTYFPLRKICGTVYEYNTVCLKVLKAAGFHIEGEMIEHKYYNGKYHNVILLALFRKTFYERAQKFIVRIQNSRVNNNRELPE